MAMMSDKEFEDVVRQANWFMRQLKDENQKAFQLDRFQRFDWSPWRGELIFSNGGVPKVLARIQVVGTHSSKSTAWKWAWADPSYAASLQQASLRAKDYGTERGVLRLIQPKWAAKEADAWEMTAVTAKLVEAKGAYRCPMQDGHVYLIFTEIRAVSDRRRVFGARTCTHVLEDGEPILLVSREPDGEVLAVCGGENDTAATARDLPLDRLLDLDPSLAELADLPDGWAALRESPEHPWARSKAE